MNDLISRQSAIDAECEVCQIAPKRERGHNCNYYVHGCKEIECIRALPSAQQWTPCSERLPKKSGRYLVTRGLNACGSLWNRIYIANYSDLMGIKSERIWWQGNVGKSDFERLDDVIAWMPLPEPYKGEES